jgi:hypothetical protein
LLGGWIEAASLSRQQLARFYERVSREVREKVLTWGDQMECFPGQEEVGCFLE